MIALWALYPSRRLLSARVSAFSGLPEKAFPDGNPGRTCRLHEMMNVLLRANRRTLGKFTTMRGYIYEAPLAGLLCCTAAAFRASSAGRSDATSQKFLVPLLTEDCRNLHRLSPLNERSQEAHMTTSAMSMNEIHANSLLASTFTHPRKFPQILFRHSAKAMRSCGVGIGCFYGRGEALATRQIPRLQWRRSGSAIFSQRSAHLMRTTVPAEDVANAVAGSADTYPSRAVETAREDGRRRLADLHP